MLCAIGLYLYRRRSNTNDCLHLHLHLPRRRVRQDDVWNTNSWKDRAGIQGRQVRWAKWQPMLREIRPTRHRPSEDRSAVAWFYNANRQQTSTYKRGNQATTVCHRRYHRSLSWTSNENRHQSKYLKAGRMQLRNDNIEITDCYYRSQAVSP